MTNQICKILNIEKPIIQGAIHTLTNAKLVAAVSKAGGLGILGVNAGYEANDNDATTGASKTDQVGKEDNGSIMSGNSAINLMKEQIEKIRQITDKPFGIQLAGVHDNPKDDPDALAMAKLMIEEKVPVAFFGALGKQFPKTGSIFCTIMTLKSSIVPIRLQRLIRGKQSKMELM